MTQTDDPAHNDLDVTAYDPDQEIETAIDGGTLSGIAALVIGELVRNNAPGRRDGADAARAAVRPGRWRRLPQPTHPAVPSCTAIRDDQARVGIESFLGIGKLPATAGEQDPEPDCHCLLSRPLASYHRRGGHRETETIAFAD
ncbi:MAG: hypothetical protein AAF899_03310 [Pseudomonadota bacterium]